MEAKCLAPTRITSMAGVSYYRCTRKPPNLVAYWLKSLNKPEYTYDTVHVYCLVYSCISVRFWTCSLGQGQISGTEFAFTFPQDGVDISLLKDDVLLMQTANVQPEIDSTENDYKICSLRWKDGADSVKRGVPKLSQFSYGTSRNYNLQQANWWLRRKMTQKPGTCQ